MFKAIPQSRLLLYFILVGLLPICLVLFYTSSQREELLQIEQQMALIQEKALLKEKKQALNMAVRRHYRDADHFYLDKNIESLVFLEPEIENLQKILSHSHLPESEQMKKRLETLTQNNSLGFSEGVVQSSPFFQEVVETQLHPVEVNGSDLQKILAKIEGVNIGPYNAGTNRPQLIILDFKLERKKISDKYEIFSLDMKLLKREFL